MKRKNTTGATLKPFLSLIFIIGTFFFLVFLQMEERRLGYDALKLTHSQRKLIEEKRWKEMQLAKASRMTQFEKIATRQFTYKKIQSSQIIHLSGGQLSSEEQIKKDEN